MPQRVRKRTDLPAPLGPIKARVSPWFTSKLMLSRMRFFSKSTERLSTFKRGVVIGSNFKGLAGDLLLYSCDLRHYYPGSRCIRHGFLHLSFPLPLESSDLWGSAGRAVLGC